MAEPEDALEADDGTDDALVWERPVRDAGSDGPPDHLPDVRVAYRKHQRRVMAAAIPLMVVLVPAMQIACLGIVWKLTRSFMLLRTLAPALGVLAAIAIVAGLANWLTLLGNRQLEARLREVVQERFRLQDGVFVGVSTPGRSSRTRELLEGQFDVALLHRQQGKLILEGMRAHYEIPYAAIRSVELAPNWQFIQLGARWCVIRHDEDGEERQLRLVCRSEPTIRDNVAATYRLYESLRALK